MLAPVRRLVAGDDRAGRPSAKQARAAAVHQLQPAARRAAVHRLRHRGQGGPGDPRRGLHGGRPALHGRERLARSYGQGCCSTSRAGELLRDRAVVVEGDRIAAVVGASDAPAEGGFAVVDLPGHTLLPGLVDCHAHLVGEIDGGHGYAELLTRTGGAGGDVRGTQRPGHRAGRVHDGPRRRHVPRVRRRRAARRDRRRLGGGPADARGRRLHHQLRRRRRHHRPGPGRRRGRAARAPGRGRRLGRRGTHGGAPGAPRRRRPGQGDRHRAP